MTLWFTSDLHLGHARICELADRPFKDLDHMNAVLINNWNERVHPDDSVFCLGDMVMGRREETLPMLGRLNGHKTLVMGNHDYCWPHLWKATQAEKAARWIDAYSPYFNAMGTEGSLVLSNGMTVRLHHFPYVGDSHGEDRYSEHRPVDGGDFLLHGHTHQKERQSGPRQIHVGVDAWDFAPVSEDEIMEILGSMR